MIPLQPIQARVSFLEELHLHIGCRISGRALLVSVATEHPQGQSCGGNGTSGKFNDAFEFEVNLDDSVRRHDKEQ